MNKRRQYCKQAQRALTTAIGELSHCDCYLLDVVELDRSRLLLSIGVWTKEPDKIEQIRKQLQDHHGVLRTALAQSTHRKRTPQLAFLVMPMD